MATIQQLKNKAAGRLGILATGQTLSGSRDAILQQAYDSLYDRLMNDNLVAWAKTGNIPDHYVSPLAYLLASEVVDDFGVSNDRYTRLQNATPKAWRDLRALSAKPYVSDSEPVDY